MADLRSRPNLTEQERNNMAQWLLQNCSNSKLRHGAQKEAAAKFQIDRRTVWRIWKSATAQQALGKPVHVKSMKKGSVHKDKQVLDEAKLKSLSMLERSSIRKLECKMGVSKGLVQVWIKQKKMIPIIKAKWPACASKHIIIQQDNAKPHILDTDPDFRAVAQSDGFNIELVCQPANSPDCNVNDLGFFRAMQTLKDEKMATTVEGLIKNVKDAFEEFPAWKLNNVFLTLQGCYHDIIKVRGNNNYKIPHMGKERLLRLGLLPECLEVEEELVRDSWEYLKLHGIEEGTIYNNDMLVEGLQQMVIRD